MGPNAIDPTGPADWAVVGWSGACILGLLLVDLACYYYKRNSIVSIKNLPLLSVTTLFGTIHILATLVSNDHIEELREIRAFNCPLWTFWLQHVFGTAPWVAVQICRLLIYANVYNVLQFPRWRRLWLFFVSFSLIVAPALAISSFVTGFRGSNYDSQLGTCVTSGLWKSILFGWVAALILCLLIVVRKLGRRIRSDYVDDYDKMINILIVGIVCFSLYSFINVHYGFASSPFRSVATGLIGFIHLFTKIHLTWGALWASFRTDGAYSNDFIQEMNPVQAKLKDYQSGNRLDSDRIIWGHFKAYVCRQTSYTTGQRNLGLYEFKKGVQAEAPARTIECIEMLEEWNSKPLAHEYKKDGLYETIVDFCVRNTSWTLPPVLLDAYISPEEETRRNHYGGFLHAMDDDGFMPIVEPIRLLGRETFAPLEVFYKKLIEHVFLSDFIHDELEDILDRQFKEVNPDSVYVHLQENGLLPTPSARSTYKQPMRLDPNRRYPPQEPDDGAVRGAIRYAHDLETIKAATTASNSNSIAVDQRPSPTLVHLTDARFAQTLGVKDSAPLWFEHNNAQSSSSSDTEASDKESEEFTALR